MDKSKKTVHNNNGIFSVLWENFLYHPPSKFVSILLLKVIDDQFLTLAFIIFLFIQKHVLIYLVLDPLLELQEKKIMSKNRYILALRKFKL